MTKTKNLKLSVSEFKAKSLGIFDEINKTGLEVTVTKRGQAIAIILPIKRAQQLSLRRKGKLVHSFVSENDIVSPLGDQDWESAI